MTTVIATTLTNTVAQVLDATQTVAVTETTTAVVDTTQSVVVLAGQLGARGPMGPKGDAGATGPAGPSDAISLGGLLVNVNDPAAADLLQLSTQNTWINSPLLDGGNF